MKRIRRLLFSVSYFYLIALTASCQSKSIEGMYAGVKLGLSVTPGGGMTRTDVGILLRSDGTFTDELEDADWSTAVKGNYKVSGSKLILTYSGDPDESDEYDIKSNGNLSYGSTILLKMDRPSRLPAKGFEYKGASGSGGIGTGTVYVGTSSRNYFYFDGKGKFTTTRHSTVAVIGDNVGGGTVNDDDGAGSYAVNNGELTLIYDNGKKSRHSIFIHSGSGKDKAMAVIDGRFFFEKDADDSKETVAASKRGQTGSAGASDVDKNSNANTSSANSENAPVNETAPSAAQILRSLRDSHGGGKIDEVKTVVASGNVEGLKMIARFDLTLRRARYELYHEGKLAGVEQIEGNSGWSWIKGKKTSLTEQRIDESRASSHTGILGLRNDRNNGFADGTVEKDGNGYRLSFDIDGYTISYYLDGDLKLTGDGIEKGSMAHRTTYRDFRNVDGLTIPFYESTKKDGKTLVFKLKDYEINVPVGTDWSVPVL